MELLLPHQIEAELKSSSIVYVPLGAIEYHGKHLPIGLDSLTSHGLCLHAAAQTGGLVMPPNYYGMTGSIGHHPWTICLENEAEFNATLGITLKRLEDFGVELIVVFTGHFGRRQLAALAECNEQWNAHGHTSKLLIRSIHECPEAQFKGDHAAIFETSVLAQLHPDLVQLDRLPDQSAHPANDPDGDSWGSHRRDPNNHLFGILGDDPRDYEAEQAQKLVKTLIDWFVGEVQQAYS